MDEDSDEFEEFLSFNRQNIRIILNALFDAINENSCDDVENILQYLNHSQRTKLLNSSINGSTPLYHAIKRNNFEIAYYLLGLSLRQGRRAMCENWKRVSHPLKAAIASGNRELVVIITQNLADINDCFYGAYTPLSIATYNGDIEYIKLILKIGADINLPCCNGITPLMMSTSNSILCRFFITEGANLDQQDDDGLTALHTAITNNELQSVRILINAGADVQIKNKQGLTPLMWAAFEVNPEMVKYLIPHPAYSKLDMIEAFEVLNVGYVCKGLSVTKFWVKALKARDGKRAKKTPFPAQALLDFSKEFTTEAELQKLENKPLQLAFQGLLVIERIIGKNNSIYLHFLLKTAEIAKNSQKFKKLWEIIGFLKEYCQKIPATFVTDCSGSFRNLFMEIANDNDPKALFKNGAFSLFEIIAQTTAKKWFLLKEQYSIILHFEDSHYAELFKLFLFMASIINDINLPQRYLDQFRKPVVKLVKVDPRIKNQKSLLHQVIKDSPNESSVKLLRLLLESGAEVDSKDSFRRTPLMYCLSILSGNDLKKFVPLLLNYGSHLDCRDSENLIATDYKSWRNLSILENPWSLQCLAADVILESGIEYRGVLPKILERFVDLHR